MGLLKLLIIFIIIYYFSKLVGMIFLPFWAKNFTARMSKVQDMEEAKRKAREKEGKITIEYKAGSNHAFRKKEEGEYVDYEEVK